MSEPEKPHALDIISSVMDEQSVPHPILQNKDYISTVKAHQERLDMVSSALEDIQGQGSKVLKDSALKAINGTTSASERSAFAETFRQIQPAPETFRERERRLAYGSPRKRACLRSWTFAWEVSRR